VVTYQIDLEKQHLSPEGGHNYAWTNCYLVDASSDNEASDLVLALAEIEASIMPIDTSIRFVCWRRGIGGPIPEGVTLLGRSGDLAAPDGYQPITNAARIEGLGDGGVVWYKRWRGPLRVGDATGIMLTADYISLLGTNYIMPLMADIPLVTRSGKLIRSMWVRPTVAMWQRRDGTIRRLRSVLAG
jgi:hypothetical protein